MNLILSTGAKIFKIGPEMQKLLKNENSGASLVIFLALFCPPVGLIQTRIKDKHSARDVDRQRSNRLYRSIVDI